MYQIIDGKAVSAAVKEKVKEQVAELKKDGISVGLAVILVGEDPASKIYVSNKKQACEALGMISQEYILPEREMTREETALKKKIYMRYKEGLKDLPVRMNPYDEKNGCKACTKVKVDSVNGVK